MTQEQVDGMLILDLIHRKDFHSLCVKEFNNVEYWEITFRGERKEGTSIYKWEDHESPNSLFVIFKTKDQ